MLPAELLPHQVEAREVDHGLVVGSPRPVAVLMGNKGEGNKSGKCKKTINIFRTTMVFNSPIKSIVRFHFFTDLDNFIFNWH